DLEQFIEALGQLPADSVVNIRLDGQIDLDGEYRLRSALSAAEARQRCLLYDTSGLRLEPTDEDILALRADGYLGEVITALREQQGSADGSTAQEALAILASLLRDRQAQGE